MGQNEEDNNSVQVAEEPVSKPKITNVDSRA